MKKINLHIEIVSSTSRGLSSMSQRSRDAALVVLADHYSDVRITIVNNESDLEKLVVRKPDLVFLGMKFVLANPSLGINNSGRIWISDYLDEFGITYTGSSQLAHERELHKPLAKQRVRQAGLATAPFMVLQKHTPFTKHDISLEFPLFVKPTNRGGGAGVDGDSLVYNFEQLRAKVESISANLQTDSLVEEYLPGREFSVAMLDNRYSGVLAVMPIELKSAGSVLSQAVKTSNTEEISGVSNGTLRQDIVELATNAFNALGARDYGRIDIRLDASGAPHFLEANLIPSLIDDYGSFPKACRINAKMNYETMMLRIVNLALARQAALYETEDSEVLAPMPASRVAFDFL